MISCHIQAQEDLNTFVEHLVKDVSQYGEAFVDPAASGLMFNVSNAWYSSAKTKEWGEIDFSLASNITFVDRSENNFTLNTNDYHNLRFEDGSSVKKVASIFGVNNPDVNVLIDYNVGDEQEVIEIRLPQGIDENFRLAPQVFLQTDIGLPWASEVKLRYSPNIAYGPIERNMWGVGLQHEITHWFKTESWSLSALIALNKFKGFFDTKESGEIQNEEQGINTQMDILHAALIGSKALGKFDLYGGVGYFTAQATTHFNGVYEIDRQNELFQSLVKKFSVENKATNFNFTAGLKYNLSTSLSTRMAASLQQFYAIHLAISYKINYR
ncbi:hypothetical protein FT993_00700 [Mesonia sp. HuA40]|nr:DUF6588 family protein [Mesonia sp. HuA40]TXK75272.1 hypothetical protein FT993_00700 [Mesonia sp. HuA40]